jgi:hypothetical protein
LRGAAEEPDRHDEWNQDLHRRDAEVAEPGVQPQRCSLYLLGKEETYVGHRRREISAAKTAQQREQLIHPQRRVPVLQGEPCPNRRDHEQGGCKKNRIPSTGDSDKKCARNSERGSRKPCDRHQGEELSLFERITEVQHLNRDDPPVQPYGKATQKAGNRDPQISVGDPLTGAFPKSLILDIPLIQVR